MSFTCQRAFSITVNPPPTPGFTEYWPFEDTAIWSTPSIGKIAAVPMGMNPGILIVPSIHGNGLQHPDPSNSGGQTNPFNVDRTELAYNAVTSTGISLVYWTNAAILHSNDFTIWMGADEYEINLLYFDPLAIFAISAYMPPAAGTLAGYGTTPSTMVTGNWYMISLVYEKATQNILLYLNTTLLTTIPTTLILPSIAGAQLRFSTQGGGAEDYIIDEVGISMRSAFTPARINWLYNGGLGRTWPEVATIP